MEITTDDGVAIIPIEDLVQIMAHGANIRLSTMDLSILTQNKISIMTLDDKYLPTAIVLRDEFGQGTGIEYLGSNGVWYHKSVLKPFFKTGSNPNYNGAAARYTHIPFWR